MVRRLVFVGLETGTIDGIDSSARVVDLDACDYVPDGDDWADDVTIQNLAETCGVPVADLWAAYEWRRHHQGNVAVADLWAAYYWRRDMETAGILTDVEDYVVRLHGERDGGAE